MTRRYLPIEGLPADRPRCVWCDRPFAAHTIDTRTDAGIARKFSRWSSYDGLFDRLRCARAFAVASYRGGYRRVP